MSVSWRYNCRENFKFKGVRVMLPKEKPCDRCIHKNVCEARNKYEEIDIKISHPFFTAKIVCSQFEENKPKPKVIGG